MDVDVFYQHGCSFMSHQEEIWAHLKLSRTGNGSSICQQIKLIRKEIYIFKPIFLLGFMWEEPLYSINM
jgi:hypothetical protein